MGANKFQILRKVIIPANIPNILSVIKVNIGLSWIGVIVGEFLVSQAGLGYLIIYGSQVFNFDQVMTSVIILCLVAALLYQGVLLVEKLYAKKR